MKKTKRILSTALIFATVFTLMPKQVNAVKKVRLNKSKLSLYVGKKYTLKLKNTNKKAKWSSTKKKIATVTKKGKVLAKKKGKCNIIAKIGRKKYICKVIVKNKKTILPKESNHSSTVNSSPQSSPTPSKKTLIYDYAQEPLDPYNCPPYTSNYDEFKYMSFRIWLCPFLFYGEGVYETKDYRGKELHYELTIKNSGNRNLPVIDVCFNYTSPISYPTVFRVIDPAYKDFKYNQKAATTLEQSINKGQTYTYSFDYTIPSNAIDEDFDKYNKCAYPIMLYISNFKDQGIYESGDEITILGLKVYE